MLRAARGPLADSMLVYVTLTNILLVLLVLAVAAGLPWLLRRFERKVHAIGGSLCNTDLAHGTNREQPGRYTRHGPKCVNGADRQWTSALARAHRGERMARIGLQYGTH